MLKIQPNQQLVPDKNSKTKTNNEINLGFMAIFQSLQPTKGKTLNLDNLLNQTISKDVLTSPKLNNILSQTPEKVRSEIKNLLGKSVKQILADSTVTPEAKTISIIIASFQMEIKENDLTTGKTPVLGMVPNSNTKKTPVLGKGAHTSTRQTPVLETAPNSNAGKTPALETGTNINLRKVSIPRTGPYAQTEKTPSLEGELKISTGKNPILEIELNTNAGKTRELGTGTKIIPGITPISETGTKTDATKTPVLGTAPNIISGENSALTKVQKTNKEKAAVLEKTLNTPIDNATALDNKKENVLKGASTFNTSELVTKSIKEIDNSTPNRDKGIINPSFINKSLNIKKVISEPQSYGEFKLERASLPIIQLNTKEAPEQTQQSFMKQFETIIKSSKFSQIVNNRSQLTIQLNPNNLGFMTIKIEQINQELVARIITSSPVTKELIESNLHQLRHLNIQVDKFEVNIQQQTSAFSLDEEKSQQQRNQQEKQKQDDDSEQTSQSFEEQLARIMP